MTIVFEWSRPFLWKPFYFRSRLMYRFGWTFLAVAVLRVPFPEFCETEMEWRQR